MNLSLLALDYLMGQPNAACYIGFCTALREAEEDAFDDRSYILPDIIKKSSVGEFYEKNMKYFLSTARDVYFYTKDPSVAFTLLPLGFLLNKWGCSEDLIRTVLCREISNNKKWWDNHTAYKYTGAVNVLSEIQELMRNVGFILFCSAEKKEYYAKRLERIEKISHALGAGYAPQTGGPEVLRYRNDGDYLSEYILANILYTWVTHPMGQLRLLVPSLPKEIRDDLTTGYVGERNGLHPGPALDTGYPFVYDVVADFKTYMDFRNVTSPYSFSLQRQFWTPFFKFEEHPVIKKIEDKDLREKIDTAVKKSYQLYLEILKTGLRYEAQYAVLTGFRGRFCLSTNLAALVTFTDKLLGSDNRTYYMTKDRISKIKEDICATTAFVKNSGLFKEGRNASTN